MAVRIDAIGKDEAGGLKLDGRLTAEDLPELLRVCAARQGRFVLDLSDLHFADRPGVRALRDLQARGAELTGASPYLSLLLDGR